MSTAGAAVAADRHDDSGGSPTERFVCESPGHGVARKAFAAAAPAPLVGFDDAAREHCTIGFELLAGDLQAEPIETNELGQVRAGEGSVGQVEVFQWLA